MRRLFRSVGLGCLLLSAVAHAADVDLVPDEEYEKKINAAKVISPLGSDFTGEQVSLYDGSTTFSVTDVDIPGNNALSVRVGRRFKVEDRRNEAYLPGFGDWDIELPRIEGVFLQANGWKLLGTAPYSRCTKTDLPDVQYLDAIVGPRDVWSGTYLYIPGQGSQELLVNDAAKLPTITDGQSYPWVTSSFYRVGCLTATANGYPGEAFTAVGPDGVRYTFNYVVESGTKPIRVPKPQSTNQYVLARSRISFLATRVEDRFGNWVAYDYDNGKLTQIRASDGRLVTLSYYGGFIQTVTANGRPWTYQYTPVSGYAYPQTLASVTQPDGSKWTYSAVGTLKTLREAPVDGGQNTSCPFETDARFDDQGYHLTIGHPAGSTVVFDFSFGRAYRSHTPIKFCQLPVGQQAPSPYAAHYWDGYQLNRKTISGPGLPTLQWNYLYGDVAPYFYTSGSATDPCPSCQQTKTVTVQEPDGNYKRHVFGVMYGINEGQLLRIEEGSGTNAPLSVTETSYVVTSEVAAQRFPDEVGSSRNLVWSFSNRLRPAKHKTITRDGDTYSWDVPPTAGVYAFDEFGKALTEIKASSGGFDKTDATVYDDNRLLWVLGNVYRRTTNGVEVSKTDYDAVALPSRIYSYGKLKRSFVFNADGTIGQIKDGAGNATTLSSWYRGIPRLITYPPTPESPAGATQSAVVDPNGWITSQTDETNATTTYSYDDMGRVATIQYPTGDSNVWNATTITTAPYTAGAEFGIAAGHWKQTVSTGSARKITYFDGLWRPLVEQEYDATNSTTIAATKRTTRRQYDLGGNESFVSYPGVSDGQSLGTHKEYDALDRVTRVAQDSELGFQLVTTTEYLTGVKTRVTNPRLQATTTRYMAFDQPTYDLPVAIVQPEGVYTDITRNDLGIPSRITRRNGADTTRIERATIYDGNWQPCKTVEPETGISVIQYDAAGNVSWTASAQYLLTAPNCTDVESVPVAERVTRSYDARNRLRAVTYPDHASDTSYTYTADGLVATLLASNNGVPVTTSYGYNKRRLLTGERLQFGSVDWTLGYNYDNNANLASLLYPSGVTVDFLPNALGQPTRAGAYATGVSYYPNGAMKQFTYGNGIVHTLEQNNRGLPSRSKDAYGALSFLDDSYDYDEAGNVIAISDGLPNQRGHRDMTYDGLDRLKTTNWPSITGRQAAYEYDIFDNLVRVTAPGRDHAYCYDAAWQLTNVKAVSCSGATVIGMGYDLRGNLENKNGTNFAFDLGNRLRSVSRSGSTVASYLYDGHGRRVQDTTVGAKRSMYSFAGQLVYDDNQRTSIKTSYVYLNGSLVAKDSDTLALGVPVLTAPAGDTTGSYSVTWTALAKADRYILQEQFNAGSWLEVQDGASTAFSASNKPVGTYGYRVRGCAGTACGAWSAIRNVVESAPTPPPATAPTLTVPSTGVNGSYTASWTSVSGASSYTLEESANGGAWTGAYSGAALSKGFTGRATGSYAYRVKACNSSGCGPVSTTGTVQVVYPPTSAPALTVPATSSTGSYTATWTAVTAATSYTLEESINGGAWSGVYTGSARSKAFASAASGTHAYRAKACNAAGCGPYSATGSVVVTYPPSSAPVVTTPATSSTGSYSVTWTAVTGATSYRLEESANGGAWAEIQNSTARSRAVSGKVDGSYSYRARACNAGGCGPYAAVVTTVVDYPPPATPVLNVPANGDAGYPYAITWSAPANATSYDLQENTNGGTFTTVYTGPSRTVQRTKSAGTYGYRVRACSAKGCSAWSATQTISVIRNGCSTCLMAPNDGEVSDE